MREPILEIVPEGELELLPGLLQAEEGIPRGAPRLTSGRGANLALLHIIPNVILTEIIVERNFWALEDQE